VTGTALDGADVDDERCGVRPAEALEELRCWREAVGCVGPVARGRGCWVLVGSEGSRTRFGAVDVEDVVLATEAE
jgi:hypothetical protein